MKLLFLLFILATLSTPGFSTNYSGAGQAENPIDSQKEFLSELKIYPNPCRGSKLNVEYSSKEISEIRITNVAGKEVFYIKNLVPAARQQIILEKLPNGIYLIQVKTTDNLNSVKKLVVATE